ESDNGAVQMHPGVSNPRIELVQCKLPLAQHDLPAHLGEVKAQRGHAAVEFEDVYQTHRIAPFDDCAAIDIPNIDIGVVEEEAITHGVWCIAHVPADYAPISKLYARRAERPGVARRGESTIGVQKRLHVPSAVIEPM